MKLKFLVYSPARKFFTDYPDRKVHQNEQQIKWMAMKFFLEGNIEKGIFFAEKAMSCHSEIFNCTEIRVSNCQDLVQLAKINNAIPNALILLDDPVNADDRVFCAKYYKAVAKWKLSNSRILSALKLIEKSLQCDHSILDSENRDFLPVEVGIFYTKMFGELESGLVYQIISTRGIDYSSPSKVMLGLLDDKISSLFAAKNAHVNIKNQVWTDSHAPLVIVLSALGYIHTLKWARKRNDSLSLKDINQSTPLMWASQSGQTEIVKYILDSKEEKVDVYNNERWTPLMYASATGHIEAVTVLLEHGATVDMAASNGWTVSCTALLLAVRYGHAEVVKKLIEHHADVNFKTTVSWTPLALAASKRNMEIMIILLSKGALIDQRMSLNYTALMIASEKGHLDIVNVLLDQAADVNLSSSILSNSALTFATDNGHLKVVKALLNRGAIVDQALDNGRTALMIASERGRSDIVSALLKKGANVNMIALNDISVLMHACAAGHLEIVKILISEGANIHMVTHGYFSALMSACQNKREEVVKFLLMNKAKLDPDQYTRLNYEARLLINRLQTQIQMVELADSEIDQLEPNEGAESCLRKG